MTESEALRLAAADLKATAGMLGTYIEHRAREIAAPRIEAAERGAVERIAEAEARHELESQRWRDLEAEFRRQIDTLARWQERHVRDRCVPAERPTVNAHQIR